MPRVSIVTSTHGRVELLKITLDSIARQNYKDFEVVVVQDGGEDITAVCEHFPFVRYFKIERDGGYRNHAIAMNVAIRQSSGELLVFQDADVRYSSRRDLWKLIENQDTSVPKLIMASCIALDAQGNRAEWRMREGFHPLLGVGASVSRKLVIELGGFDERFEHWGGEDYDLIWRMQQKGCDVCCLPEYEALTEHQWHEPAQRPDDEPGAALFCLNCIEILEGTRSLVANEGK